MQVYILDQNYEIIGIIDEADSILWQKKYNDIGEAEIYVPCDEQYISLLRKGNYLYRFDDDMFCKIEKVEIETDVEEGDYIIATAKDICSILAGRIVRWQFAYSGSVAGFIKKLLTDNVINCSEKQREVSNFEVDINVNSEDFTEHIEVSTKPEDLLQLIIATCKAVNYGFRASFDIETSKIVFRLYKGKNRASAAAEQYVEFSPYYSNIISSNYIEDESGYKNIVYVGYKSADEDDENTYLLSLYSGTEEPQGEERREVYIDGTGTSRDITIEELTQMFPSVSKESQTVTEEGKSIIKSTYYSVIDGEKTAVATSEQDVPKAGEEEKEEKITITDYTYLLLIRAIGQNTLSERIPKREFTGAIDTVDTFEYKKDYDLGDIVKVANSYGIEANARITEVLESKDNEDGYAVEPTFEFI